MKEFFINFLAVAIIASLVIIPIVGLVWFSASREAAVFNKFSVHEKEATTWDAVFAELRVEACQ